MKRLLLNLFLMLTATTATAEMATLWTAASVATA